jgi:quinoprotein glucose dehydrogenase
MGDVRAWNVRTGRLAWRFHSVPQPGEPNHDSWPEDTWKNRTGVNVWTIFTVDAQRGIVYLPFGQAAYDYYGGDSKGSNLYGDSLVALDAATGKTLWYRQFVHTTCGTMIFRRRPH